MNGKKYSKLAGLVLVLVLFVMALPVTADDSDTGMLPEDAKLGYYISSQGGSEMAPVDVKLGQYIIDDFDYAAAADNQAARWQAMAEFYAANDMLNFSYTQAAENQAMRWQAMAEFYAANDMLTVRTQALENDALRWSAVDDYYSRHGLRNVQVSVAIAE